MIAEASRNNVGSVCTAPPTLLGPRTFITHGLQRLMGCILSTMHCRSQHCWELLHPFADYCQHARNNSKHCWRNNVGNCCVPLHTAPEPIRARGIRVKCLHLFSFRFVRYFLCCIRRGFPQYFLRFEIFCKGFCVEPFLNFRYSFIFSGSFFKRSNTMASYLTSFTTLTSASGKTHSTRYSSILSGSFFKRSSLTS